MTTPAEIVVKSYRDIDLLLYFSAAEMMHIYLQRNISNELVDYDQQKLREIESRLKSCRSEILHSGRHSTVAPVVVQFLGELIEPLRSAIERFSRELDSSRDRASKLIPSIANFFSENRQFADWVMRSERSEIQHVVQRIGFIGFAGLITDDELAGTALEQQVEHWVSRLKSLIGEVRSESESIRSELMVTQHKLNTCLQGLFPYLTSAMNSVGRNDRQESYIPLPALFVASGAFESFLSARRTYIDDDTKALAPWQEEISSVCDKIKFLLEKLNRKLIPAYGKMVDFLLQCDEDFRSVELLGDSDFIKTAVAETKKYFHKMRDHAIRKLVTAIDLARLGDFLASQEIVREIQADVYQFDLNYDLVERERAECLEVLSKIRHFSSKALSELERLDTKWNHFWAKEHDVLNACLGSVQGLVMQRGWRKGGEGWKALQVILNDLRPASEFAGRVIEIESIVFDENAALPAPRDIPASTALLNSLCAIASVDGDFDQQEQNLVLAIAKRLMPSFSEDAVFRLIRNWVVESSKSELSRHLYQAVSDCERIKGSNLRDVSKEAFVLVAKADGNIEENERKIIRKMIAMLS